MGYLGLWRTLEEISAELRKRHVALPSEIIRDLRSAKALIGLLRSSRQDAEVLEKLERYLGNVEFFLITEGEKMMGERQANHWSKLLDEARRKPDEEVEEMRFVARVPRNAKWIRVVPHNQMPLERLKTLAAKSGLSYEFCKDGSLLVYGTDNQVKDLVKRITDEGCLNDGK